MIPLVGFYLQKAVGGPDLSYRFWRRFAEIEDVVAIKIAPFDRYRTLDVVRAVAESGRDDIALYTGNDDQHRARPAHPLPIHGRRPGGRAADRRRAAGPLGRLDSASGRASRRLPRRRSTGRRHPGQSASPGNPRRPTPTPRSSMSPTASPAASPAFTRSSVARGCSKASGVSTRDETLSPGQAEEIDRVYRLYPELNDDDFVAQHRDEWLRS